MVSWKEVLEKETDLYPTQQALLLQFSQRLNFGKAITGQWSYGNGAEIRSAYEPPYAGDVT